MTYHEITLPAATSSLSMLSDFVARLQLETPNPILIELALNELFMNAFRHGHARWCKLHYQHDAPDWQLTFSDDGMAFDPLEHPTPPPGELREGGYGLLLLREIIRREGRGTIHYRRERGWNHTALCFSLEISSDPKAARADHAAR